MSFMSFKLAAPSLEGRWADVSRSDALHSPSLEARILLQELVKVRHEFVDCIAHVHVSDFGPHRIQISERGGLVLVNAGRGLEFVAMCEKVSTREQ